MMPWSSLTHEFDQSSPELEVRRLFNFSVLCIILLGLQELQILSVLLFHYCNKKSGQYISLHWDFGWQMQRSEREQSCCWLSPGKLNSNETHVDTFGNIELNCSVLRWEEQQSNITFSRLIVTFPKNWYPPAASSFPERINEALSLLPSSGISVMSKLTMKTEATRLQQSVLQTWPPAPDLHLLTW